VFAFFVAVGPATIPSHEGDVFGPDARTDGTSTGTVDPIPGPALMDWSREGIVLDLGPPGSYDSAGARSSFIMKDGAVYRMWYSGFDGARWRILYATSTDAVSWTRDGVAIDVLTPPYNFDGVVHQSVMKEGSTYKMWFAGGFWAGGPAGLWQQPYYAESPDAVTWTIAGPALGLGPPGAWDDSAIAAPDVVRDTAGQYRLYYAGWDGGAGGFYHRIGLATSADGRVFARAGPDPVLPLGAPGSWESGFLTTPYVIPGAPWQMWYAGSDGGGIRIGLAASPDGVQWTKAPDNPEFTEGPPGAWDSAGVHAGQIVQIGAETFLYYTGYDGSNYRIGRARWIPPVATGHVDCDPDTINIRSHGRWITCYLEPGPGHTANDVVAVTVRLDSWLAPVLDAQHGFSWDPDGYLVDHDHDGTLERLLKFDRQLLSEQLTVGEHVFLIQGEYTDGAAFSVSSETIRVID